MGDTNPPADCCPSEFSCGWIFYSVIFQDIPSISSPNLGFPICQFVKKSVTSLRHHSNIFKSLQNLQRTSNGLADVPGIQGLERPWRSWSRQWRSLPAGTVTEGQTTWGNGTCIKVRYCALSRNPFQTRSGRTLHDTFVGTLYSKQIQFCKQRRGPAESYI